MTKTKCIDDHADLSDTFMAKLDSYPIIFLNSKESSDVEQIVILKSDVISREALIHAQENDPVLTPIISRALSEEEAQNVPVCYYMKSGILLRKWRPPHVSRDFEWEIYQQIVIPTVYQPIILSLAEFAFSKYLQLYQPGKKCLYLVQFKSWYEINTCIPLTRRGDGALAERLTASPVMHASQVRTQLILREVFRKVS